MAKVSLENYVPRSPGQGEALKTVQFYCDHIQAHLAAGIGVTFWGSVGAGKTHLATCILKAAAAAGKSSRFKTEDGIFDALKSAWSEPAEEIAFIGLLQKVRFLLIDDFGTRKPSEYVSDRYEAIINTRYAAELPTIVTTNYTPEQLAAVYPRQMSRLRGNMVLEVTGPDGRGGALNVDAA